jgi:hypothetical protein
MASIRIVSVGLCPAIDCAGAMKAVFFPRAISDGTSKRSKLGGDHEEGNLPGE